jgi:hypothetical protein
MTETVKIAKSPFIDTLIDGDRIQPFGIDEPRKMPERLGFEYRSSERNVNGRRVEIWIREGTKTK